MLVFRGADLKFRCAQENTSGAGILGKFTQFLQHTWRRLATGICFAVFGISGLLIPLTALPVLRLTAKGDRLLAEQKSRRLVQNSFKFFIGFMRFMGVFNFAFPAAAHAQNLRGKIIIANHPCLIDVVALISFIPNGDCVVKAHLWKNPFMRGVIKSSGYISNGDPDGLIADCKASLERGNNLIIFPEGTRSTPGQDLKFQRGAANLALRTATPMAAFKVTCTPPTLLKNAPWYAAPAQKPTLKISYLREFEVQPYLDSNEKYSLAARQLTRDLENFYNKVVESNGTAKTGY
ncbi:1-acyl-sn-glycerol-3-phosphate acyltransferase [Pseudidiomarina halophila]|uniref:1-acyl-sn-glycerol-3-phosphate acyltransferase n=1 Tax=Pseudidiomarina halophila TaxID=1449799 RepID=A0A432XVZ4_9GAMM|nr:1-acyl-sn-glycerol-3-phosphate acyltransferase [Pseudidiomarina halophila]